MTKKDNTIQPHITTKFETMAQTHDKNMTSWQSNTIEDSLDYTDSFSQSFLSPMSTTLQDLDDLNYSTTTTGGGGKKKLVQALPVYEEATTLSDYSMTGYVGPMDIHHQRPQRHSMLAGGSKQYNIFIHDPKLQQQHQHHQLYTNQPYPHQQHTTTLINNGYNSSTSSSFSPPSSSTNFPMSAPANIGYEFNLNTRQQQQQTNGSPNPNHHLPMSMSPSSQQVTDIPPSMEDDYAMQINLQAMMEKRRRRRESHNAVERRRRENINDRIQELGSLLPQAMLDEITNGGGGPHSPSTSTGHPGTSSATTTATTVGGGGNNTTTSKPNKGAILRKSVDHIKLLQQEVNSYQRRVKELESILASYHSTKQE
ncbi:unnamed protein product [Cunninghamella echinulata]